MTAMSMPAMPIPAMSVAAMVAAVGTPAMLDLDDAGRL
jgi:hypothetical protein